LLDARAHADRVGHAAKKSSHAAPSSATTLGCRHGPIPRSTIRARARAESGTSSPDPELEPIAGLDPNGVKIAAY
jgi:hypothetical protein